MSHSFDIAIGSELMYYKTDVSLLADTVADILTPDGIFIHTHHFRVDGLEMELMQTMASIGLQTLECDPVEFLTVEDRTYHPEWLHIKCLVSAPPTLSDLLLLDYPFLKLFRPSSGSDLSVEYCEIDSDTEPEIKMSMDELMSKYNIKL